MLLRSAFCSLGLFPKSDAKVANLVIRMYLLGKKCKVNQLIIPFKFYAMQGVWKHAALCLQLQRKATVLPKVFQGRVQIIYFFVLLCTPIVGRECKFPDRYSIYFHRDYKCKQSLFLFLVECMLYSTLRFTQMLQNSDYLTNIPWVFRIANLMQPQQVVPSFILILHLGIVGPDTFRPMVKLIVLPSFGIRQPEQVVPVPAER